VDDRSAMTASESNGSILLPRMHRGMDATLAGTINVIVGSV
jgi:hypothetical protein